MKLSRLNRRDFIESMLLVGLGACAGPRAATRVLRDAPPRDPATGPWFAEMARLTDELARARVTGREYAHRVGARLMELELEDDVLADWEHRGPADPGIAHNGTRVLHRRDLSFHGRPGGIVAVLFYTPAGVSNPPHEHHNLHSVKRVLRGSYHVRQYERLRRVEPGVIAIRQVSELVEVAFDGPYIDMTDDRLNVHWFGTAGSEPVLALNLVVIGPLAPADTFHGAGETRAPGQYYIDPTGAPDRDGVILAPAVEHDRAEELARRPLSAFPSHVAPPSWPLLPPPSQDHPR
jgi:hypothetical protein